MSEVDDHVALSTAVQPLIENAIEGELAKRGGGMLTGFLGIFTYIDNDGDQAWGRIGQVPIITAVGMVDILQMSVRAESAQAMGFLRDE